MPDRRQHRGPHPSDAKLFAPARIPILREAVRDLSWLLSRGYAEKSALKLVGDRYRLRQRQRLAVRRSACSAQARELRQSKCLPPGDLHGQFLLIDGFNILITVESALSGGLLLEGQDGCIRDLASIHGTYKRVVETTEAIELVGKTLESLQVRDAHWLLDRPVSNSGRLRAILYEIAEQHRWDWRVDLHYNPDNALVESPAVILSSDSIVLDGAARWFNLLAYLLRHRSLPEARVLPLH